MAPSLIWIPSANNIADVDFANVKPLNPGRFQQQAGVCLVSQPQSLTAQRPQRGEPSGRAPRSCGRSSRSAYIPAAVPVRIFSSVPPPVKFTWHGQTLYRYLWGTIPFPVETNCPHLEHQPPFYTTVGHIPVPGEFHEGCLFPLSKDNSGLSQDFIIRIMVLARKWNIVQSLD